MLCELDDLKANLGITGSAEDAALTSAIAMANSVLAGYIGVDLSDVGTDRSITRVMDSPCRSINTQFWPVVSVSSISVDGNAIAGSDYDLEAQTGIIYFKNGGVVGATPTRYGCRVTVVYKCGFATVPEDLATVCLNMAATIYKNGGNFSSTMAGGKGELKSLTMFDAMSMSFETGVGADADSAGTPGGMIKTWSFILDKYRCTQPVMA